MKFIALLLTVLTALATPALALAANTSLSGAEDPFITSCTPTASVKPEEKLPSASEIVPSGKLALPAGKSIFAPGQTVYLSGKVLDANCVPVSDAIIEIWQADASGKYTKASLGDRLSPFPTFVNTGRAVTDNLGLYRFVTIFPGIGKESAPHIHVRVTREHFKPFETEMYFAGDNRNSTEERFGELTPEQQQTVVAKVWPRDADSPDKGLYARWNITLADKNRYRHY